jgi:hypothetical protein
MDADGFTIVVKKAKGRKRVAKNERLQGTDALHSTSSMQTLAWRKRHDQYKRQIRLTKLFETLVAAVETFQPQTILCYGLGRLSIARCALQLALACTVCEVSSVNCSSRLSFDPMHGGEDHALLAECGFTCLDKSVLGKDVSMDTRTLFFMPHCERWMYCEVLAARESSLDRTLIIGNSLKEYVAMNERTNDIIQRTVAENRVCETALALLVDEEHCTLDSALMFEAFNNTRILRLSTETLAG